MSQENCGYYAGAASPSGKICFQDVNGMAVVEGDIAIGSASSIRNAPRPAFAIAQGAPKRWPHGVVPYLAPDATNAQCISQAIQDYQRTNLHFIQLSTPPTDGSSYIQFLFNQGGDMTFGVGRNPGVNTIYLGACVPNIAIHEIGHALGLFHEQTRIDRDQYITILWDNITPNWASQYDRQLYGALDLGPYDYVSIMHYPARAYDGRIAMVRKDGQFGMSNTVLSDGDIAALNKMAGNYYEQPIFGAEELNNFTDPPVRVISSTEVEATLYMLSDRRGDSYLEYATSLNGPWVVGANQPATDANVSLSVNLQDNIWQPHVTGLQPNTRYYFRAWVRTPGSTEAPNCNSPYGTDNTSVCSAVVSATTTPIAAPSAPVNLQAAVSGQFIHLSWQSGGGSVDRYLLEYMDLLHKSWTLLSAVDGSVTSFDQLDTLYDSHQYRVRAQNVGGSSSVSNVAVLNNYPQPNAPTNFRFVSATTSSATVAWDDDGVSVTGFKIVQYNGATFWDLNLAISASDRQATITGLSAATTYRFAVKAFNPNYDSPVSNIVLATTATPITTNPPAAPTNLRQLSATGSSVTLAWDDTGTNVTGFVVEQWQPVTASYQALSLTIGSSARQATVSGLSTSTTYYFQVKAVNGIYYSAASNAIGATTSSGVVAGTAKIQVTSAVPFIVPGNLSFSASGASNLSGQWVGLFPAGSSVNSYVGWTYVYGTSPSGTISVAGTLTPGQYVLRLFQDGGYTQIAESAAFAIQAQGSTSSGSAKIQVTSPTPFTPGAYISFAAQGAPNQPYQWVGIAPQGSSPYTYSAFTYITGTSPSGSFYVPSSVTAGYYVLRLFLDAGYTQIAESTPFYVY